MYLVLGWPGLMHIRNKWKCLPLSWTIRSCMRSCRRIVLREWLFTARPERTLLQAGMLIGQGQTKFPRWEKWKHISLDRTALRCFSDKSWQHTSLAAWLSSKYGVKRAGLFCLSGNQWLKGLYLGPNQTAYNRYVRSRNTPIQRNNRRLRPTFLNSNFICVFTR